MRKHRRLRIKKNTKQTYLIIGGTLALLFVFTTGYAAFGTNIGISAKGNLANYKRTLVTNYITNLYNNGDTTLIDDGTDDHNIRYSGKPVNNYICLKNEKPCQDENLYRIIGVFNNIKTTKNGTGETRIKIIKSTKLIEDYWDTSKSNNWARPATLNTTLQALPVASNTLIDSAVWYLGAVNADSTPVISYKSEREANTNLSNETSITWEGSVALIYPSDYGYASKACYLTYELSKYGTDECKNNNWIYNNLNYNGNYCEWMLSPSTINDYRVNNIGFSGNVNNGASSNADEHAWIVRPSLYLKSNVNIIENGNNGSETKPYFLEPGN